jgi:tRNA threonylcarbamoyl adenosine modification protein YeaZ
MLLLALDTAGPDCAAALVRFGYGDEPTLAVRTVERIGRGHAERLMPVVEATLAEGGASYGDLDRIAVTTGPGSFTGIRVGVAAARGLALALDIPATGVGSLEALIFGVARSRRTGTAVAVLDARRGEVYARARDIASDAAVLEPKAARVGDVATELAAATEPLILTGSGAPLLVDALDGRAFEIVGTRESPDIADVAALALRDHASTPPVPFYVRGADAKPQAYKAVARR